MKETIAANVRAWRHFRGMEQTHLARRMQSSGFDWHRATVSEIERRNRNVTIAEALGLAIALDVTVEQLIDSRGGGQRGPSLILNGRADVPDIPPASVTALLCPHIAYAETVWSDDNEFLGITITTADEPQSLLYAGVHGEAAK